MPPESHNISRKSPGRRRCALAVLIIGVLTTLMCDTVIGQQLPFMQAPYYQAPQRPAMSRGLFYLNAGVKYRNIQEVSFKSRDTQLINIAQPGVPAYGPGVDDILNYPVPPTYIASDPPSASGIWLYDDGFLEPTPFITQAPAGSSFFFPVGHQGLGRVGIGVPNDFGTWMVADVREQADDGAPGNMDATQHFRFTKVLDGITPNTYAFILAQPGAAGTTLALGPAAGTLYRVPGVWAEVPSRGFAAVVASGLDRIETHKTLVPYVEAGFQVANYFDLFGGFSWIPISESFGRSVPATVFAARRAYRDTFPFHSDSTATPTPWPANPLFWSGSTDPTLATFPQAEVWPYGATDSYGRLPYRRFFNVLDPAGPTFQAQEILRSTLDATAYEMRLGARSWFPLNGQGRIGTTFGFLFTPLAYHVDTFAEYVATAPETTFAVSTGQTLVAYRSDHRDIRWNYGIFVGTELEFGGNDYFLKGGADYNYYFNTTSYGGVVLTTINVGGFSATVALGRRF